MSGQTNLIKACPLCGCSDLYSYSRTSQYKCNKCKHVFPKYSATVRAVKPPGWKRLTPKLEEKIVEVWKNKGTISGTSRETKHCHRIVRAILRQRGLIS